MASREDVEISERLASRQLDAPDIEYVVADDLIEPVQSLSQVEKALRTFDDPIAAYLRKTALSCITLCDMLQSVGTSAMVNFSRSLYGSLSDLLSDGTGSNLDAAHRAKHLGGSERV